jgi:hypothetical protein
VRERLRKVSQLAFGDRIVFFGQKANVVPRRQKPLEKLSGLVISPLQDVIVGQPKTTCQKHALSGREAVRPGAGVIPKDIAIADEIVLDGSQGAPHGVHDRED